MERGIKLGRKTGWLEGWLALEGKTTWIVDVWDCHGVLKPHELAGKGSIPKLKGVKWECVGWFTIPVRENIKLSKKQKEDIEKILFRVVNRQGAINMSGFYPVFLEDLEKIHKIVSGERLRTVKTSNLVEEMIRMLKRNKNKVLETWSSISRCWEGCQGFHESENLYWNGREFKKFVVGCHHAWYTGMWDIKPKPISNNEAKELIKYMIERDREEDEIYDDELEHYVSNYESYLRELKYCRKHREHYFEDEECSKCEEEWLSE